MAMEFTLAQEIKADIFATGDKVDATAISKGKGFQGAIKRHNQHRGPMTHGSKFLSIFKFEFSYKSRSEEHTSRKEDARTHGKQENYNSKS